MDFGKLVEILLSVAIPILVPAILAVLVAWLKQRQAEIEREIGTEWWWAVEAAVLTAVRAAEQSGVRDGLEEAGEMKLSWAIDKAEAILAARGLEGLDLDVLKDLIEAEVHRFNGK